MLPFVLAVGLAAFCETDAGNPAGAAIAAASDSMAGDVAVEVAALGDSSRCFDPLPVFELDDDDAAPAGPTPVPPWEGLDVLFILLLILLLLLPPIIAVTPNKSPGLRDLPGDADHSRPSSSAMLTATLRAARDVAVADFRRVG